MALDPQKCELILSEFKSLDVEKRLNAIEEARKLYREMFQPEFTEKDWAFSAMIVEQFYNLIREELRVSQIRIKADLGEATGNGKPKKAVASKPKPKKNAPMDMGQLIAAFAAFKKGE